MAAKSKLSSMLFFLFDSVMQRAENKYKMYKNKLTNIIRTSRKEYYNKILNNNKNSIKGTWDILNNIIKNSSRQGYPQYFTENDIKKDNMNDIVDSFNQVFFVSVGPSLAEKFHCDPLSSQDGNDNLIDRNPSSMFLTAVEEK